ncbi:hypothetical protein TBLA_0A07600 [Henningerozyma blattae CBS 6284]|uniref:Homeobox domain-containing protein n=1 Tax=Henningerozyma blattae (strain ATCC 34711 / CBS 6284 / DSM 70876 / NBRC 10599 / NRRL Y-10934 / UCD 77-7) TaxID=1071380 RepID=I2GWP8_HENB6|nr:hypothetical protein TBLA_0A07600 [Tetrapisispora blattae CBS 6284]CCH58550.1 hypothetical protein TBLA_0A07600 [Tetrapisispora blattae CBS 6284]
MNKIPIDTLLNPTNSENIKEQLQNLNKELLSMCSRLPSAKSMEETQLSEILKFLTKTIKHEPLGKEETELVTTTVQLSTVLSSLVKEARQLHRLHHSQSTHNPRVFNVLTQHMMSNSNSTSTSPHSNSLPNSPSTKKSTTPLTNPSPPYYYSSSSPKSLSPPLQHTPSHRGHRLPKHTLIPLEKWFLHNKSHPYLHNSDLQALTTQSSLSKTQVKNWISNRRRKERYKLN